MAQAGAPRYPQCPGARMGKQMGPLALGSVARPLWASVAMSLTNPGKEAGLHENCLGVGGSHHAEHVMLTYVIVSDYFQLHSRQTLFYLPVELPQQPQFRLTTYNVA